MRFTSVTENPKQGGEGQLLFYVRYATGNFLATGIFSLPKNALDPCGYAERRSLL